MNGVGLRWADPLRVLLFWGLPVRWFRVHGSERERASTLNPKP